MLIAKHLYLSFYSQYPLYYPANMFCYCWGTGQPRRLNTNQVYEPRQAFTALMANYKISETLPRTLELGANTCHFWLQIIVFNKGKERFHRLIKKPLLRFINLVIYPLYISGIGTKAHPPLEVQSSVNPHPGYIGLRNWIDYPFGY